MSKIKKIVASLGMVAGVGISLLPMAAYADPGDYAQASEDLTVNLLVNSVISMTIKSYTGATLNGTTECNTYNDGTSACTTTGTQKAETTILPSQVDNTTMYSDIFVSTNSVAGYTLKLIDADEVTSLVSAAGDTIVATSNIPSSSNTGWAVSIGDTNVWQAIPNNISATDPTIVAGTPITVTNYTPATPAITNDHQSTVHYGVAATPSQPVGTYTDTVIYTATAK